jgi:hypothetical protein
MTEDKNGGGRSGDPANLPMYLGPYEAWNFGTGRDYALPIMRRYWRFISALAEIGVAPGKNDIQEIEKKGWLPTLWGDVKHLAFIPFIVDNPIGTMPGLKDLESLLFNAFIDVMQPYWYSAAPAEASIASGQVSVLLDRVKKSRFRVAFPVADEAMHKELTSGPQDPIWHPDPDLHDRIGKNKKITVMAVIDDGLPFAHRNFRDVSGTRSRIEFCWLQSVAIDENQKSVLFGREYTREQIEDLIKQYGNDEDTLYREAGATADTEDLGSMIDRHATHGAHVMDLATGYAPERCEKPAEEIRIIAVQLPNTIAWDTSGFGKDMYMLSAFHYILHRADIIAAKEGYDVENMRLVINFSYGFSGGRHDGGTELEAAINQLIQKRRDKNCPTALVLPAGNTFLERLHGLIRPRDFVDDAAQFHWRVQPNDRTPSYLELWFWQGFNPHGYRIELWDPWGRLRSSFGIEIKQTTHPNGDPNHVGCILNDLQQEIGQISVDVHRSDARITQDTADQDASDPGDTGRWRVLIVLAPTEPEDTCLPRADAGKWTVVVRRGQAALIEDPIHCWIQRSADPESLRSGSRQSYFDNRRYEKARFTPQGDLAEEDTDKAFVKRFGSLNGLATGSTSLVVGGYRLGAGLGSSLVCARPSRYSSAGVLDEKWPYKQVDCSSMSDRSRVLPGTIAAGVRSGSLSFVQGTSSAAPFVARQLAETFVIAKESDVQQAKDNYLSLLRGYKPETDKQESLPGGSDSCRRDDDPELLKARLGAVLVPPHWQPGIQLRACDRNGKSENSAASD